VVGLCDKLNHTTSLLDLALGVLAEVACADDNGNLRDPTLAENLAVAEREEVEDGSGVGALVVEVLFTLLEWDEGPELEKRHNPSVLLLSHPPPC